MTIQSHGLCMVVPAASSPTSQNAATPAVSIMSGPPAPPVLHHWYLAEDDTLHFTTADGTMKRTTKVVDCDGLVATTLSGRRYRLGKMHDVLLDGLHHLNDDDFDPTHPLEFPELLKDAWMAATATASASGGGGGGTDGSGRAPPRVRTPTASSDAPRYSQQRGSGSRRATLPHPHLSSRLSDGSPHGSPTVHPDELVSAAPPPPPAAPSGSPTRRASAPAVPQYRPVGSFASRHAVARRDDSGSGTPPVSDDADAASSRRRGYRARGGRGGSTGGGTAADDGSSTDSAGDVGDDGGAFGSGTARRGGARGSRRRASAVSSGGSRNGRDHSNSSDGAGAGGGAGGDDDGSAVAGGGGGAGAGAAAHGVLVGEDGRRRRDKPKGGVRFGDVQIREYERVRLDSPRTGTPRLGLGWKLRHQTLRRLDSLEAERADTRVGKEHLQPLTPRERSQLVQGARGLLADSLPASPRDKGYDAELDDWHLGADGSVYHSGGITSKVGSVSGRIVTTSAYGSRYKLLTVKPAVAEVLDRLGIPFDADNPLQNASSLVYAWTVHLSEPEMLQVRAMLKDLEAKLLPFGASVKECFVNIDVAVRTLGFPEPPPLPRGAASGSSSSS